MFFVVFLPPLRKNVIIPANWIYNIEDHLEKFINNGLNKNQWFLFYYTTKPQAFVNNANDQPDEDFTPDFTLDLITEIEAGDDFDGVFFGVLVNFKSEYLVIIKRLVKRYSFHEICVDVLYLQRS